MVSVHLVNFLYNHYGSCHNILYCPNVQGSFKISEYSHFSTHGKQANQFNGMAVVQMYSVLALGSSTATHPWLKVCSACIDQSMIFPQIFCVVTMLIVPNMCDVMVMQDCRSCCKSRRPTDHRKDRIFHSGSLLSQHFSNEQ